MRDLVVAMGALEAQLQECCQVSLNEAMVLCCISADRLTASKISENIGLTASNTSKVLRSAEDKELIVRSLGETDRRQMSFSLTDKGAARLQQLKAVDLDIPEFLRPLFA